jgi:hypothetical protein
MMVTRRIVPNITRPVVRAGVGLLAGALIALAAVPATAEVPGFVPVQGRLTDAAGEIVDGQVDVVLTLYSDQGGGSLDEVWSVSRTITVEQGSFSLYLGTEAPLDMSIFSQNEGILLGMAFGEDSEMPLVEIGTVPYAAYCQVADEANTVAGRGPDELGPLATLSCNDGQRATFQSGSWTCTDPLTEDDVDQLLAAAGYLTPDDVATVASSGDFGDLSGVPADLADGDDDTLASLSCSNGQVAQQTAGGWACGDVSVPGYTASPPIQISGTNISLAPNGVTGAYIAPETITDGDVAPNAAIAPTKINGTAATLTGDQSFDQGTLVVDSVNHRVGVGTASPGSKLHVSGDARVDGDVVYDAPRTSYVQFPPSSFEILSSTEDEEVQITSAGGYLYISGGASTYGIIMGTPVSLPHGSTVTELACFAYDNNSTVDLGGNVDLYRRGMTDTFGVSIANADFSTTGVAVDAIQVASDTTITDPVVDNGQYNYWLDLYMYTDDQTGSTMRFYGCRIEYQTSRVLP